MASTRITKRVVDSAQPTSTDIYLWDADLSGFGLKITPAGRKVYLIQYRLGGRRGRTRRITIGHHGELTPITARMEASEVALGRDPASDRDKARADKSLGAVLDQFLTEHVKPKRKASTAREYQRIALHPAAARAAPSQRNHAPGRCKAASRTCQQTLPGESHARAAF